VRHRALIPLLAAALALPALASAAEGDPLFTLDDVFELEWARDPRLAPDGDHVVYVRTFHDRLRDARRSNLWLVDTDDGSQRPLTSGLGSAYSPRFSPDGERLAWIAATDDGAELFVHWLESGSTARLTQLPASPRDLAWSPDGAHLAFAMHVDAATEPMASLPPQPEGADWAPPARVVRDLNWRADGRGILEPGFVHAFVVPADGGTPRQLTDGDFHHDGGLAWMPDGDALIVSANRREDAERLPLELDLFRVPLHGGAPERLTDRDGPEAAPVVSPDGERIAFTGFEDEVRSYQVGGLWTLDLDDGSIEAVAPELDRSVSDVRFVDRGRALQFAFTDRGVGTVARVDRRGRITRLAESMGGTAIGRPYAGGSMHALADGRFVFTHGTPARPAEVAVASARGEVRVLTDLSGDLLDHRDLASVTSFVTPSSHDGLEIQSWLAMPPEAARGEGPLPLILEIHGGPHTAYGPEFSAEVQLMAAAGYAVLYVNPRGSTSYGEAFATEIDEAYPGRDYDDLMSAVDAVLDRDDVAIDPDRLFVTGGSGGGVLTAWIVGTTDRFRAAVVAKPVINWTTLALTSDISSYAVRHWFPAPPWEAPEHYWERSPLSRVGEVSTPTMLLTGEDDLRTPMAESEQYYQALRLRGIDTALVRIPGASHGIAARPTHLMSKVAHILAWFEDHDVDGEEAATE
jgi:acylaminoacyl-peptidase